MTHTEDGDPTVSKALIYHSSTNKPYYILNVGIIETRMVDHDLQCKEVFVFVFNLFRVDSSGFLVVVVNLF